VTKPPAKQPARDQHGDGDEPNGQKKGERVAGVDDDVGGLAWRRLQWLSAAHAAPTKAKKGQALP
jgi:hypothetical protein